MAKFVQTPFFMFNSKFDAWQMDNDLRVRLHFSLRCDSQLREQDASLSLAPNNTCPSSLEQQQPAARVYMPTPTRAVYVQVPCLVGEASHKACSTKEQAAILQYGIDFLAALLPVIASAPKNGAFITSCVCHGCPCPP